MFVYYRTVRVKDEIKQQAIIDATIELVNEIGFVSSSVSKIAKKAGVSPATIYIYYENKEDLIVSTYMDIKTFLGAAVMEKFDPSLPVRDSVISLGKRLFRYIGAHPGLFNFAEQFSNSPYQNLVDMQKLQAVFQPLIELLQYGIDQKIIKDAPIEILFAHLYTPIYALVNPHLNPGFKVTPENMDFSMEMAWDAIKL